jgi:hypothetical protein
MPELWELEQMNETTQDEQTTQPPICDCCREADAVWGLGVKENWDVVYCQDCWEYAIASTWWEVIPVLQEQLELPA